MRLYAVIAATIVAAAIFGGRIASASADTTSSAGKPAAPTYVTVQTGDTLSAIASSYGTTYVRIFDANSTIVNPDLIYPGQKLLIPLATTQLPNRALPSETVIASQPAVTTPETPTTEVSAPTAPVSQPTPVTASTPSGSIWDELAQCESGGDWSIDTGNGFYGGLQFTLSSWEAVGGAGYPNQASRDEQIYRAQILQSEQGWGAWPVCSLKVGL